MYRNIFVDDNLQELHGIHDIIQQMRDAANLGLTHVTCSSVFI